MVINEIIVFQKKIIFFQEQLPHDQADKKPLGIRLVIMGWQKILFEPSVR